MRLVFAADTHLKPKTWKHRDVKGDSYFALSFIFKHARNVNADAVLLAGDIFDSVNPEDESVAFFLREAAALVNSKGVPIPIYTVKGNHDKTNSCGWTVISPGVSNVTNLDGEIVTICGKTLLGWDFCYRDELIERLKMIGDDIDIVMMHTHVAEALQVGSPQISVDDLPKPRKPRLYLLGDIHKAWHWASPDGMTAAVYPGVTYPSRIDETQPKQFLEISLTSDQRYQLNVIPLPSRPVHRPVIRSIADAKQFIDEAIPRIKSEVHRLMLSGLPNDIAKPLIEIKFTPVDEIRDSLEKALRLEGWCHYFLIPLAEQGLQSLPSGPVSDTVTIESAVKEVMGANFTDEVARCVKDLFFSESPVQVLTSYEAAFGVDMKTPA